MRHSPIYAVQVLEHYVRCSRTNNHTTREAACTCIAELASKIDAEAVRPHVPIMLRTLITCLRDDSWPVRHSFQRLFCSGVHDTKHLPSSSISAIREGSQVFTKEHQPRAPC